MSMQKREREGSIRRREPRSRRRRQARQRGRCWIYIGVAAAAVVLLAVLLPLLLRKKEEPELVPGAIIDSAMTAITGDASDISYLLPETLRISAICNAKQRFNIMRSMSHINMEMKLYFRRPMAAFPIPGWCCII